MDRVVTGKPDSTVEPSGGVVGPNQRNTDKGRCPLVNPSEMLTNASLLLSIVKYRYDGGSAPCCYILRRGWLVWVLACDRERFGRSGKSPTNSTRNLNIFFLCRNKNKNVADSWSLAQGVTNCKYSQASHSRCVLAIRSSIVFSMVINTLSFTDSE